MLLNMSQFTAQTLQQKSHPVLNITSAKVKKLSLEVMSTAIRGGLKAVLNFRYFCHNTLVKWGRENEGARKTGAPGGGKQRDSLPPVLRLQEFYLWPMDFRVNEELKASWNAEVMEHWRLHTGEAQLGSWQCHVRRWIVPEGRAMAKF